MRIMCRRGRVGCRYAQKKVVKNLQLPNGSVTLRGIAISPDGKNAYVTHVLRAISRTTQLSGLMNTNALTIIDVPGQAVVNTVLVDDVDLGAPIRTGSSARRMGNGSS